MPQKLPNLISSTAGAVPVKNEKGELTMQKVKVTRYVSGRRPEYAISDSESESSDDDEGFAPVGGEGDVGGVEEVESVSVDDRRLQRLRERQSVTARERRPVTEPEVLYDAGGEESPDSEAEEDRLMSHRLAAPPSSSESSDEDLDEEALEQKRELMRERARQRDMEEDVLDVVEEEVVGSGGEESSEYEEYTDSEDEAGPRLKPVFVRKLDRVTIRDQDEVEKQTVELEKDKEYAAELRKKESHRLVEAAVKEELAVEQGAGSLDAVVVTDDENDEMEYEEWKVRELKRIKRDREERDKIERERDEIERMHNMTEEERKAALRNQPKQVTNQMEKGKYKFLQKYYHRGAFYLDEEENVLKRDIAEPTLEDHFDKTVLPKVMQVKNFGRAGRTKYTHLVDQDTTEIDSPWTQITPVNLKFQNKGGGAKQIFVKPTYKKRKLND